jgi:hypothetical protein
MGTPAVMKEYWKKLSSSLLELLDTRTTLEKSSSELVVSNHDHQPNNLLNKSKTDMHSTSSEAKSSDSNMYFYFGLLMVVINFVMFYLVVNLHFKVALLTTNFIVKTEL